MADEVKNYENEEAVIGAVMRGGLPVYNRVKEILKPEMFGWQSFGAIWEAIGKLEERGMGIDTITVGDELERLDRMKDIVYGQWSGRMLLADLRAKGDPRHIETYAENVQDYHVKKYLAEFAVKINYWSRNGRRAPDIVQDVVTEMGKIVLYSSRANEHTFDAAQSASAAYDETDKASRGLIVRVPTGIMDLDKKLSGGFEGTDLVLVAARPGQGKTALLITFILNMMREGKPVLLFSLEMNHKQIAQRLISQITGIDLQRLRAGKLREDEWTKHAAAVDELANMRDMLTTIDMPSMRIGNIRQMVRREMSIKKYAIIMVDYIQLAEADEKEERRQVEVGRISKGLKNIAKELDVPVLAAAQLNRASEQRADKRPILADLREAGDLEQDSDIVIMIHRQEDSCDAELLIRKYRNGPVGTVSTFYDSAITRFKNSALS